LRFCCTPNKEEQTMTLATTLEDLHARLPDLAAEARSRGAEFESARRLAADFALKLKQAGVARMLVPKASGGLDCSLPDWLEVMMQLAEADASTAWVSAHAGICSGLICASADARFRDEFFADPLACASWSNLPRVQVHELDDGLQIHGSWAFESGCTMASHVGGRWWAAAIPTKRLSRPLVFGYTSSIRARKAGTEGAVGGWWRPTATSSWRSWPGSTTRPSSVIRSATSSCW